MAARDFANLYPRRAAELRQIGADTMLGWVAIPRGPRPAGRVLPDVAVATTLFTALIVSLAVGLTRWDWAAWCWWAGRP